MADLSAYACEELKGRFAQLEEAALKVMAGPLALIYAADMAAKNVTDFAMDKFSDAMSVLAALAGLDTSGVGLLDGLTKLLQCPFVQTGPDAGAIEDMVGILETGGDLPGPYKKKLTSILRGQAYGARNQAMQYDPTRMTGAANSAYKNAMGASGLLSGMAAMNALAGCIDAACGVTPQIRTKMGKYKEQLRLTDTMQTQDLVTSSPNVSPEKKAIYQANNGKLAQLDAKIQEINIV